MSNPPPLSLRETMIACYDPPIVVERMARLRREWEEFLDGFSIEERMSLFEWEDD
jgi:hypothetical protein